MAQRSDDQQRRKNLDSIRGVLVRLETMAEAHSAVAHGTEGEAGEGRGGTRTGQVHPLRPDARQQANVSVVTRDTAGPRDGRMPEAPRNPDDMDRAGRFDAQSYASGQSRQWELSIGAQAAAEAAPAAAPRAHPAKRRSALVGMALAGIAGILVCVAGLLAFDVLRLPSPSGNAGSDRAQTDSGVQAQNGSLSPAPRPVSQPPEAAATAAPPVPARSVAAEAEEAGSSRATGKKSEPAAAPAETDLSLPLVVRIDPGLTGGNADYYVTVSGLPAKARLEGGRMVFPGSYAIEPAELSRLKLVLPAGTTGPLDVTVVLVARPGRVLAEMPVRLTAETSVIDVRSPHSQSEAGTSGLLTRALQLIEQGETVAARRALQQAAEGGDADAALVLATSFDPRFAAHFGPQGAAGDVAAARRWYAFAAERGSREASDRLRQIGP